MNRISEILRKKRKEMGTRGYQVLVHLVGIRYHKEILQLNGKEQTLLVEQAGLIPSFKTELVKGAKLGRHVKIHPDSEFADCLDLANSSNKRNQE